MIRTARRPSLTIPMLGVLLAVVAFAPVLARAAGPGAAGPGAVPAVAAVAAKAVAADSDDAPDHAPRLMVMGDFNRDGIADMAEATSPAGDHAGPDLLTVSLGQADGTFQKAAFTKVLGHTPRDIVAGDFNKDGISDLIVGDDDGTLMLFLGDGTGNLVYAGEIAHLDSVVSIAVADFNHDGIPDLAVSDWRASAVTVLLGASRCT